MRLTFPVQLGLRERDALVIGAATELLAKVDRLLDAGARVTLISDAVGEPPPALSGFVPRATLLARPATDADLEGRAIVFVAPWTTPEEEARARRWHAAALRTGTLLCTVDRPETSTFTNVAEVHAGGLAMTFGSGGRSPGVVRRIREDLEVLFGDPRFARFLDELAALRTSLPRGERAARMSEAVRGFAIEARLRFPAWFERGEH